MIPTAHDGDFDTSQFSLQGLGPERISRTELLDYLVGARHFETVPSGELATFSFAQLDKQYLEFAFNALREAGAADREVLCAISVALRTESVSAAGCVEAGLTTLAALDHEAAQGVAVALLNDKEYSHRDEMLRFLFMHHPDVAVPWAVTVLRFAQEETSMRGIAFALLETQAPALACKLSARLLKDPQDTVKERAQRLTALPVPPGSAEVDHTEGRDERYLAALGSIMDREPVGREMLLIFTSAKKPVVGACLAAMCVLEPDPALAGAALAQLRELNVPSAERMERLLQELGR